MYLNIWNYYFITVTLDAIMQDQDEFITRDTNLEDVALVANDRANLEDIGCNADLYIANQEDLTQTQVRCLASEVFFLELRVRVVSIL